jgi:uncharacterized OB-fold protein
VQTLSAHPLIRLAPGGAPYLEAYRCSACGAMAERATLGCRKCAAPQSPVACRVNDQGSLWTWSVVHRSYPGVAVPFVSALVDMDDGLTIKGTVKAAPDILVQGMRLRVVFDDAGAAVSPDGAAYAGFHFVPAGVAA